MSRSVSLIFVLLSPLLFVVLAYTVTDATVSDENSRRPLDLPSGGPGTDEDEEDAPEIIQFWGSEYEGDAFFWLLDRSGSMSWEARIDVLKAEMTAAVSQLSSRSDFGVVSFADNFTLFNEAPVRATPGNRASATAWIVALVADGWTCMAPAAVRTIELSNQSHKRHKVIIFVGDGVPTCDGPDTTDQVLNDIAVANFRRTKISTIYISSDQEGIDLFTEIANSYGGTFTNVPLGGG